MLGIAAVLMYCGSLDYRTVFEAAPGVASSEVQLLSDSAWGLVNVMDAICILLFIGAMGNRRKFRCMFGSPTRWKAQRRSRR